MQTLEPIVEQPGDKKPPLRGQGGLVAALFVLVPLSLLLIQTKVGVIVGVGLAIVAGILLFIRFRGFAYIQVVGFLVHFDGLGRAGITVGRLLASVTVLVLLYKLLVERWRPPATPAAHWFGPLALYTWALVSGAWAPSIDGWFYGMGIMSLAVIYYLFGSLLVDSTEKVKQFLRAFWWGGMCGSSIGVMNLPFGWRSYGFAGDANYFGLLEAAMIPLTIYYRRNATTQWEKRIYTAALVFVLIGAAGAGSRSGMIGATLALVATMVTRPGLSVGQRAKTGVSAIFTGALLALVLFFANPSNLERGIIDSSATGRLDFWRVTQVVIAERPITGQGLAQLRDVIPARLPTTPGVQKITDSREAVSSHNSWFDLWGDLGIIGLGLFASIWLITFVSLFRPRWPANRQLSTTLATMVIPVISGSFFLPLINNKLGWSVIGLAASMQVPSWGTRYKGYFADRRTDERGEVDPNRIARWDLRISQRFRAYLLVGAVVGASVFGLAMSRVPPRYEGSVSFVMPDLDLPANYPRVRVSSSRMQAYQNLILSKAYAGQLKEAAGLDLSIDEIVRRVSVARPKYGPYFVVSFIDADEALTRQAAPHLLEALDALIETGRQSNAAVLEEEARPLLPGEQRYYTGDMYLPVTTDPGYKVDRPRVAWVAFVGGIGGFLVALAFVLLQQRRPRVNNDDDFPTAVGLQLWTHVGRRGRRNAASSQQYAQVAVMAYEMGRHEQRQRRMLVASPQAGLSARTLAMGLAASLASGGERVVLVDGQVERPWLSLRLAGWRKPGLLEVGRGEAELAAVIRRVRRFRLPRGVRRTVARSVDNLRFVPVGRVRRGEEPFVDPAVLDGLDPDVIAVMVSPSLLGTVPASPSLRWADVVLYCLVEGGTVTFDAEDAALRVRSFSSAPAGVVLADV